MTYLKVLLLILPVVFGNYIDDFKRYAKGSKVSFPKENGVLHLTDDTIHEAIKSYDYILIKFFAEWCGHCKALHPKYEEAAKKLHCPLGTIKSRIYNAKKELSRCISSLITQNSGGLFDYQIVAIDDGSTDGTSSMLDEYAKVNERFIVFHKENGGPAAARKYGIDNSQSDYLAFCDADDYVDQDWLLTMYKYLKEYDADISRIMAYINDKGIDKPYLEPYTISVWNREEAIEKFIEHKDINGILWNNLYKRALFDGLEWNFEIKIFEDAFLVWQILSKLNTFVKVRVPKYHYMFSPNSLTNISYNLNRFESTNILIDRILSDCEKMNAHLSSASSMWHQWKFSNYLSFSNSGNMPKEFRKEMRRTLSLNFSSFFTTIRGIKNKISLISLIISPSLTERIYQLLRK